MQGKEAQTRRVHVRLTSELYLWSYAQVTIKLHRGKKRQEKETAPGAEMYQLTANAAQMVQSAAVRFLRVQLMRGVFAACYDRLELEEQRQALFARTQQPGFVGLSLEDTGYKSWEAMADRAEEMLWAKCAGTANWVMFPAVDSLTGALDQCVTFDARSLGIGYKYSGYQVGFERNRWGLWVLRKKGTAELTEAGRGEDAAMWLGHAEPGRQNQRQCYVRGARNFELGALSMGREVATLHLMQFAAHRVPRSEHRRLAEVHRESPVYCEEYEKGRRRCAAIALVSEIEGNIREVQGRDRNGPLRLQAAHLQQLRDRGAEQMIEQREAARAERLNAESRAVDCTLVLEHKRKWRLGQEVLECSPISKLKNETTWGWPALSEAHAVAFSLGRPEFTAERMGMRLLPEALSEAMLQCGAIGMLTGEDAREFDRTKVAGTSSVERSNMFEMWCNACDTDGLSAVPILMQRRGASAGDAKSFRLALWCPRCDCKDHMRVRMTTAFMVQEAEEQLVEADGGRSDEVTSAELVDRRLRGMAKPTVDRGTYQAFLHYDGDLYSGGPHAYGGRRASKRAGRQVGGSIAEQDGGNAPTERRSKKTRFRSSSQPRKRQGKLVAMKCTVDGGGVVAVKLKPTPDMRKAAVEARQSVRGDSTRPAARRRLNVLDLVRSSQAVGTDVPVYAVLPMPTAEDIPMVEAGPMVQDAGELIVAQVVHVFVAPAPQAHMCAGAGALS